MTAGSTREVAAFQHAPRLVDQPAFDRRCWHIIAGGRHPVTPELSARSADPLAANSAAHRGVAVLLGEQLRPRDNHLLLDGIASAKREAARLVLVHLGAGGNSLLEVAALEDSRLRTLAIELPRNPTARAVRRCVAFANSAAIGVVLIDNDGDARVPHWTRTPLAPTAASGADEPGSVLVTGGLGGLGVRVAAVLSRAFGLHPVLVDCEQVDGEPDTYRLGRAAFPQRPAVVELDIADPDGTRTELARLQVPPIRALVHCAGVMRVGPVVEARASDLLMTQLPKSYGLRNVLSALDVTTLRSLLVFGSATGVHPHRNMASYSLANEQLRRTTEHIALEVPNCRTVAAEWSLWSGAGLAHDTGAVPQARRMGMVPVPLQTGMRAVLQLTHPHPAGPRHQRLLLCGPGDAPPG